MNGKNLGESCQNAPISGQFACNGTPILTYDIGIPSVERCCLLNRTEAVNSFFCAEANRFFNNLRQNYCPKAAALYKNLAKCGKFQPWKVQRDFTQMYCRTGISSIFIDTYFNMGDGQNYLRDAYTFCACKGKMSLGMFFKAGYNFRNTILQCVKNEIQRELETSPNAFYKDWETQISCCFSVQNFYLADDGFVVFYGQRTIAPRAFGVVSFLIPYSEFGSRLLREL